MPNLIEKHASANLPSYLPPNLDHELRTCVTRLIPPISASQNRYMIAAADAPSDTVRRALAIRRDNLDRWLQPAGIQKANDAYDELVRSMATSAISAEDAPKELETFIRATAPLPLFALTEACQAFITGKIGDGKWMPKPGQICIEAGKRVAELARERREIEAVLTAEIKVERPDSALRAQNLEAVRVLTARALSMGAAIKAGRSVRLEDVPNERIEDTKETAQARLTELQGKPLPAMGPFLRRSLEQAGAITPQRMDEGQTSEVA